MSAFILPSFFRHANPYPYLAAGYFGTADVTLPRLQKFSVDILQRLRLNNLGGIFSPLLANLPRRAALLTAALLLHRAATAAATRAAALGPGFAPAPYTTYTAAFEHACSRAGAGNAQAAKAPVFN